MREFAWNILDGMTSHIAILDHTGQIIYVNRAWREFAEDNGGSPASTGVGVNYLAVCDRAGKVGVHEANEVAQAIRDILEDDREKFRLEYACHSPDQSRWFSGVITKVPADGHPKIVFSHEDITERKLADINLLRRNKELTLFNRVIAAASSSLSKQDALDVACRELTKAFETDCALALLLDDKRQKFVPASLYDPGDVVNAADIGLPVTESLEAQLINADPKKLDLAESSTLPEQILIWLNSLGMASMLILPLRAFDNTQGFIGLASREPRTFSKQEINLASSIASAVSQAVNNSRLYAELENYSSILEEAIKQRTHDLRRVTEHVQTILSNSPDPIILLRPDLSIDSVNPAFGKLFGYDEKEVYGRHPAFLIEDNHQRHLMDALQHVQTNRKTQRVEVLAWHREQRSIDVSVALSPVAEESEELIGIVCTVHDITEIKEVERMKDGLISTAAHELRTPLTSIRGFSEILLSRDLAEPRRQRYLELINQQAVSIAAIIDDMLDVSRLEAGIDLDIDQQPVDVNQLFKDVVETFKDMSPDHQFEFRLAPDIPPTLADSSRILQVIRNLVSNAVKYSPGGGIITITTTHSDDHLIASISDEGIGMTVQQQSHLFEKFWRADMSNTAVGGTGLGLHICKLIVTSHGGWIWADSRYGEGTTFYFSLPLSVNED